LSKPLKPSSLKHQDINIAVTSNFIGIEESGRMNDRRLSFQLIKVSNSIKSSEDEEHLNFEDLSNQNKSAQHNSMMLKPLLKWSN
jgi:hypothetical protein